MSTHHLPPRPTDGDYDVIVVGAGTTGLALASLLGEAGTRVAIVDPVRVVAQFPRATHIDDETMRAFQAFDACDESRFLTYVANEVQNEHGEPLVRFRINDGITDQAWRSDYMFHQPDWESRVRGRIARDPNVTLWFGWKGVELSQDDATARLVVESREGARHVLTARYLVGADGAGSWVRQQMGSPVKDLDGTQRSLIVDIHPFVPSRNLDPRKGFLRSGSGWPLTYIPIAPPMIRFERMLRPEDDARDQERPEVVYEMLEPFFRPGDYRIMRTDAYEWHAHLVQGWRRGRLLVAGDAAHTMPPMLGQGMCSGMRDSFNLAWKLSAVVAGRAPETLLDTYESERSPHVEPFIVESARQAKIIETTDRDAAGPARGADEGPEIFDAATFRPPLGPGLLEGEAAAGAVLSPQPVADDGRRFDDIVGYRFAVYALPEVAAAVDEETRRAWAALDAVLVTEPSAGFAAWAAAHGVDALIVRPDRYTYAATSGAAALRDASLALRDRLMAGVNA